MSFVIKAEVKDCQKTRLKFEAQKTMYGGKNIAVGDCIFIFASENEGGHGLFGRGVVLNAEATPRTEAVRQTPRVTVEVELTKVAKCPLGRTELRSYRSWVDGRPETELNFKLYRQATNKIVGLSDAARQYLEGFF
ncbi:hypothetical protein H3309_01640 [Sandaracinobacteroides saxicola]|uniref:Uncharacterized protein n=1 Tax=Sandaracinobacteroides saxicola TaxID=2759707 RepID=A0A7G5IM83_9SPHN|nr:hypothetical protein H3309_01640 [Sandaracinobacteroides saxicola]